ncbi:hypothetical protein MMC26_000469 [Xylographa opegraphella]|nr:hypothetical protein [Xylographa opegraphella]
MTSTTTIATTSVPTFLPSMTPASAIGLPSYPTQVPTNSTNSDNSSGINPSAKVGIGVGISIAALVFLMVGLAAGCYVRKKRNNEARAIRLPDTEIGDEIVPFGTNPKNGHMSIVALYPVQPVEMEGDGLKQARYTELGG